MRLIGDSYDEAEIDVLASGATSAAPGRQRRMVTVLAVRGARSSEQLAEHEHVVTGHGGEVTFRDLGVDVPGGELVGFGVDPDGELVTLSLAGPVARIVAG